MKINFTCLDARRVEVGDVEVQNASRLTVHRGVAQKTGNVVAQPLRCLVALYNYLMIFEIKKKKLSIAVRAKHLDETNKMFVIQNSSHCIWIIKIISR